MSRFSACVGCANSPKTCDIGRALTVALRGFNVSHVKHKCFGRAPLYRPGDAVLIRTRAWQTAASHECEDDPPWCDFQGRFVEQNGNRAICFIAAKAPDTSGKFEFEPTSRGFVKVPFSRVSSLPSVSSIDTKLCQRCGAFYGLTGWCDRKNSGWNGNRPCIAETADA